jgi:Spy/CpxP family protein refolding chaperone
MVLALVAGLAGSSGILAGPFLHRPTPPTASELGLDAEQAAEWQAIQTDAQALRQATLQQLKIELEHTRAALADPEANLAAIGQEYQAIALAALLEQRELRKRRLAFYDSLDPAQQAQVRAFLIELSERAERAIGAIEVLAGG